MIGMIEQLKGEGQIQETGMLTTKEKMLKEEMDHTKNVLYVTLYIISIGTAQKLRK